LLQDGSVPYVVSSGGGPGMMEAANRGAAAVDGGLSMGLGISLPHEHGLNEFVTPELGEWGPLARSPMARRHASHLLQRRILLK
jgi:predicted Rossmann-fold nucleotide-binding protein